MNATGNLLTVGSSWSDNYGLYVRGTEGIRIEGPYAGSWRIFHATGGNGADLRIQNSQDGNFWYFNLSGNFGRSSDISVKKDVAKLEPALDRVMSLRPVTFRYKNSAEDTPKVTGFIAQEVEPLFPDLVTEHDGLKGVAEINIIPIAVAALQEEHQQRRETDARHEEEVRTLKAENAALLKRLEALEKRMGMEAPAGASGEIK